MAQNAENIEAKLCAYVDGELDARGRAEIEKHLQSNPQHRKLLEALSKTHRFVAELPRENAPPEILENLQGQLERAVLLADVGEEESDAVPRINRWPQITSLAAIVLLTVGLGVIVYYMLPPLSRQPDTYSILQDRPPATRPAELPQPAVQERAAAPRERSDVAGAAPPALMARNTDATQSRQDEINAIQDVQRRLSTAARQEGTPDAQPQVLLVVNTDDPSTTQRQLLAYLQSNQIQWKAIGQDVATTQPNDAMSKSEQGEVAPAATLPSDPSNFVQPESGGMDDLIVCPNMSIQQANELAGVLPMWRQGQRAVVVSYFEAAPSVAASQPATAPSPLVSPADGQIDLNTQTTQPAEPATRPAGPVPESSSPLPPLPPQTPQPRLLQPGDRVQLQITLESDLELKKEMPIGDAGTIILPLVGEIHAAGLTEAQLAQSIAEAYRTRNISPQPLVQVSYLDPATQPPPVAVAIYLQNDAAQSTVPQAKPSTEPTQGADDLPPPPTTAPSTPSPQQ